MVQLKKIGVLSAAKIIGVFDAILGLIGGALISVTSLIGATSGLGGEGAASGIIFGLGAVVCLPILYGAIGFIIGAIGAFIYNFLAQAIGGIEIELGE